MLEGWLMAAAKRRSGGVNVDIIDTATQGIDSTTITCTFSVGGGIPADGEQLVALISHTGPTPDIITVPSGFTLRESTDVNRTVRLYDKTASGEASASYVWASAAQTIVVRMVRLTPCSLLDSGVNNAASTRNIDLSATAIDFPQNSLGIGMINLGGTGAGLTNSSGYTQIGALGNARGAAFIREYTTAAPTSNCAVSWTNLRSVDSLLGVYG